MRSATKLGPLMERNLRWLILGSILPLCAHAQSPAQSPTASRPQPEKTASPEISAAPQGDLKSVLVQMDQAARSFKSTEADVELVQYTKIVDDTSKQSGHVFFRRHGNNIDVALLLVTPHPKQVVVSGDSFSFYDSKTRQCMERKIGDYRADVKTMMNLGFGGRGQELLRDFDVKLAGWETVDNVQTARLELVPKSDSIKRFSTRVILWIDPRRDIPLKQQRFELSGDYQLTQYTDIRVPGKVSDDLFRLKTCGKE